MPPTLVPMNDEQRFMFDLKGWLLLPGVLGATEVAAVKAHVLAGGSPFAGPAQELLDHPAIVDVLTDVLSDQPSDPDAHPFRCESSFVTIRSAGWTGGSNIPHVVLPARRGGPMTYQCRNGRIYAGLTRVVWELNPVRAGMGGTQFLSGTHKAEFPFPGSVCAQDNAHLESYACPAGSAFIFSESLLHAGTEWRDREHDRVSIFSAYNSLWAQWHRLNLEQGPIDAMPPKRRSLFRGVWAHDFREGPTRGSNREFAADNRSL